MRVALATAAITAIVVIGGVLALIAALEYLDNEDRLTDERWGDHG